MDGSFAEVAICETEQKYKQYGFAKLEQRGSYLYTSTKNNNDHETHIGQMRVSFFCNPCNIATVIAQHMQNDDGEFTFRKWNPKMTAAPWGFNNDATKEAW